MDTMDSMVQLFVTQHHARELHGRHIAAIQTLCRDNPSGLAVRDLPRVVQVLDISFNLINDGVLAFVEPVCCLIRTLSKPYLRRTSLDELKLLGNITELLDVLKQALNRNMPEQLQACTAEFLTEFASAYHNRPHTLELADDCTLTRDLHTVQRLYYAHQSLLAHSHLAETVCSALQASLQTIRQADISTGRVLLAVSKASNTHLCDVPARIALSSLTLNLLETATEFSYSAELCQQLLQAGVLPLLVQLLHMMPSAEDASGSLVKGSTQVIELLWNLFELAPAAAAEVLTVINWPKGGAVTTAVDAQAVTQPCTVATSNQPWASNTVTATPLLSDVRTKSSPCSSSPCSRSNSNTLDNMTTKMQAVAGSTAPDLHAIAQADNVVPNAAVQTCWPGSNAATPEQGGSQQTQLLVISLVEALLCRLEDQMNHSHSLQDKEARNDTLAVLYHLSSIDSCSSMLATSRFMTLVVPAAAEAPDMQSSSNIPQMTAVGHSAADVEMQLLIWSTLGRVAASSQQPVCSLTDCGLLRHLMSAISGCCSNSCLSTPVGSPEQVAACQQTAWSVLQQVAPLCKTTYCGCNGVAFLLDHLSDSCTARGTDYLGSNKPSNTEPALRLLQRLVTADESMSAAFLDAGVVPVLLQLLLAPGAADAEPARASVLLLLAELCETVGSSCREQLRQADAVGLLLRECEVVLANKAVVPGLLDLSALNAVWRCCLPSSRCRAQLLALNGMDLLLELLQHGNKYLRPVVLAMLADLLEDRRAHPFFMEWHSPSMLHEDVSTIGSVGSTITPPWCPARPARTSAAQLLLDVWRDQSKANGLTGDDGILTNINRPLAGCTEHIRWCVSDEALKTAYGHVQGEKNQVWSSLKAANSPDLLMDKVYACFAQLDCDALAMSLPPADAATLAFMRQYVKFRQGEVWQDIKKDFETAGLSPTQEDRSRVVSGIQHAEHIAGQVAELQQALLSSAMQEQRKAEKVLYDGILAQAAADAKAKVYEKDSSKLSMKERLAAKARKEVMLKHSLANSLSNATMPAASATSLEVRACMN